MKIYKVDFIPIYPVGGCLIIAANDANQAKGIAKKTLIHTNKFKIEKVNISKPCIIEYLSGEY